MPTKNPRITVTLTPEVHALLRRLSELGGESQSALLGGILQQSMPVLERVVKVLEAAHLAKETLRTDMAEGLKSAQHRLEEQLGLALTTMDEGARPLLEHAEAIRRRAARGGDARGARAPALAARSAARTPMSNRGVTPHPTRAGKAKTKSPKGGR